MTPVNNKSLLHFIFDQMEKLDKSDINVEQAKAQANLAKQANNSLKYELDRAVVKMKLSQHNRESLESIELREAEGKNFEA
jgi:hypothetical protein